MHSLCEHGACLVCIEDKLVPRMRHAIYLTYDRLLAEYDRRIVEVNFPELVQIMKEI